MPTSNTIATQIKGDLLAIEMLNNSIQLDSSYAPAYVELGFRQKSYGNYALAGAQEISKAEQAYLRALSLNDELLGACFTYLPCTLR